MTEEELIAEHLAKKGVTRCPTVAVAATTATISCGPLPEPSESIGYQWQREARTKSNNEKSIKRLLGTWESQKKRLATFAARRLAS